MRVRIIGAITAVLLAVIGAVVLVLYVRDADQRAMNDAELVPVYIVAEEIPAGTSGDDVRDSLRVDRYPAKTILPGAVTDLSDLTGLVATIDLLPGDQLIADRFVDPALLAARGQVPVPAGMQEVTVALPIAQVVGGAVLPGSTVGVVVTDAESGGSGTTQFILRKVLVTRIVAGAAYTPSNAESDGAGAPVSTMLVTFALETPDVEKVVWAAERELIWLTLEPEDATEDGSRPVDAGNIFS